MPLNAKALHAFRRWREQAPQDTKLVFPERRLSTGHEARLETPKKAWAALLRAAQNQGLLGHSTTKMTGRYTHLLPDAGRSAVALLA